MKSVSACGNPASIRNQWAERLGNDVAELLAVGDCHSLCLAPNTELAQDVRDVRPDRFPADERAFSDVVLA
jgi:hypothetical protein